MSKELSKKEIETAIEYWRNLIKNVHEVATSYKYEKNIRLEQDLDLIIYKSLKIKDPKELAAHFLYEIATKHPFYDGNKRTALLTSLVVLAKTICEGNKELYMRIFKEYLKQRDENFNAKHQSDKRLVKFMENVADKKKTKQEVIEFIEKQFIKAGDS